MSIVTKFWLFWLNSDTQLKYNSKRAPCAIDGLLTFIWFFFCLFIDLFIEHVVKFWHLSQMRVFLYSRGSYWYARISKHYLCIFVWLLLYLKMYLFLTCNWQGQWNKKRHFFLLKTFLHLNSPFDLSCGEDPEQFVDWLFWINDSESVAAAFQLSSGKSLLLRLPYTLRHVSLIETQAMYYLCSLQTVKAPSVSCWRRKSKLRARKPV